MAYEHLPEAFCRTFKAEVEPLKPFHVVKANSHKFCSLNDEIVTTYKSKLCSLIEDSLLITKFL